MTQFDRGYTCAHVLICTYRERDRKSMIRQRGTASESTEELVKLRSPRILHSMCAQERARVEERLRQEASLRTPCLMLAKGVAFVVSARFCRKRQQRSSRPAPRKRHLCSTGLQANVWCRFAVLASQSRCGQRRVDELCAGR